MADEGSLIPDFERTVGRYEVVREIGRGGMAVVFLARQTDLGREVALKELGAFHAGDRQLAERFLRESRLAGSLSHPNVVTVHEYFQHAKIPYIAMEYVPHGSLRPYVGRLALPQVIGVFEGVLAGLAHAESKGIVHRDLKPENIMVTAEGRVKIADFGIAKATQQVSTRQFLTATGTTVGTPAYMAPEQVMGNAVGPWTDLYSVGIMAYEFIVGQHPYHDVEAPMGMLMHQVNQPITRPIEVAPQLDPALSEWIERLVVKEPAQRTQSASEAWDDLEEIAIRQLGPRWRREARLPVDESVPSGAARDLTPAPFQEGDGSERAAVESEAGPAPPLRRVPSVAAPAPVPEPAAPEPEPVAPVPEPAAGAPATVAPVAETVAPAAEAPATVVPAPETVVPAPESRAIATPPTEPVPAAAAPTAPASAARPRPETLVERWKAAPAGADAGARAAASHTASTIRPSHREPSPVAGAKRRHTRAWGVLAAAVAIAAAAGYLVGPASHRSAAAPERLSSTAAAGPLQIGVPADWQRSSRAAAIPGLKLTPGLFFQTQSARNGGAFAVGMADGRGATLLPASFTAGLTQPPVPTAVRLGSYQYYRYLGLVPKGTAQPLNVYALPTSSGVVLGACTNSASATGSFAVSCERVMASLQLLSGRALPLGPNPTYAAAIASLISRLTAGKRSAESQLRGAKTASGQAQAATHLSQLYAGAASDAAKASPGPAERTANDAIVAALRGAASAYSSLGTAAAHNDQRGFGRASGAVMRASEQVRAAVSMLSALGYRLG